jgi:hypothetical protein
MLGYEDLVFVTGSWQRDDAIEEAGFVFSGADRGRDRQPKQQKHEQPSP